MEGATNNLYLLEYLTWFKKRELYKGYKDMLEGSFCRFFPFFMGEEQT